MNIVFIAPHGTGKGTQCDKLVSKYNYNHISTGELIRKELKKENDFSKEIKSIIDQGKLISDEIVLDLIKNYLLENNISGNIIFDGYPRTIDQAKTLDELMTSLNQKIDLVVYLKISKEEAMKRTFGRLTCPNCGKSYNKYYEDLMPQEEGICDDCKGQLVARSDDTKEAFESLFKVFLEDTYPILDYYKEKGILKVIDASLNIDEIFKLIEESLEG